MLEQSLAAIWSGAIKCGALLVSRPTETSSFATFLAAFVVAAAHYRWKTRKRRGGVRPWRRVVALIFPKSYVANESHFTDLRTQLVGGLVITFAIGNLLLSAQYVSTATYSVLTWCLGSMTPTMLNVTLMSAIMTAVLYLAYELAYWIDHYVSHTIPILWEFHRVHHEAEVLSPATNFRTHPVDTIVFANITAIVTGSVNGLMTYLFGQPVNELQLFGINALIIVFAFLLSQLQHTHIWIAFTGIWGKLLLSPAHHQIHHSQNPAHFNRNLGSSLAIFDWLFGTLHMPSKQREKLTFGIAADTHLDHQSLYHSLVVPFFRAFNHLRAFLPTTKPVAAEQRS